MQNLPKAEQPAWNELFVYASKLAGRSDPPAKAKETLEFLEKVGKENYRKYFLQWLEWAAASKATEDIEEDYYYYYYRINDYNTDILKGLVFIATPILDNELCRTLANFALKECFKGSLLERLGTGSCKSLGMAEGACGISHLIRIRYKVKKTGTRKSIDGIIEKAAKRLGLSKGEVEDLSVSGFGLSEGKLVQILGDHQAHIILEIPAKALVHWFNPDGKEQKSVPAEVKNNFAAELKQLKETVKQIEETLSTQKERMDRFYLENRSFTFPKWQEFYLDHGLMQFLCRRLIWTFEKNGHIQTGIWLSGKLVDVHGKALEGLSDDTVVRLWHPIEATVEQITCWRNFMETHKIQQPMKQAYREVYLLTAAEVNTNMYSNRFASHILKQNQFTTLARLRDWKYTLILGYDGGSGDSVAERKLAPWGLVAEFWINQLDITDHPSAYSDGGSFLYVGTDQVRFTKNEEALPLHEVPPLVLSEILRDVDLFVGVSSIGNDPNWTDGGTHREHQAYWQSYSFGNLNESAKVRKEVLENLLPKLKIASKCSIEGKFLKVKGSLRTYKIHLGSGNILMEPNDQYLCIVPSRNPKEADKLFLPFEGDRVLSLVLSKAFLLAEDTKITDTTITSQIQSK
ncbi:DUF4132 domain-containing protein [Rhodocytophaga rosea]|uniref:DUF4132 domain-containing protein n=1 Tax=Rhodocytophaga rosea TaxID=2704465 RepID=A0A6C0GB84_9BACT|nr:DUF4132 domain-containing protein [Rhodocytophaga rosea]QHT65219.1 DUF4132 domain-containing protein [Rhodocytophaga rosea]